MKAPTSRFKFAETAPFASEVFPVKQEMLERVYDRAALMVKSIQDGRQIGGKDRRDWIARIELFATESREFLALLNASPAEAAGLVSSSAIQVAVDFIKANAANDGASRLLVLLEMELVRVRADLIRSGQWTGGKLFVGPNTCKRNLNCTSVIWNGIPYSFNICQSIVVRLLWEEFTMKRGMTGRLILSVIRRMTKRKPKSVRDIFKVGRGQMHPAFGEMIISSIHEGSGTTWQLAAQMPPS